MIGLLAVAAILALAVVYYVWRIRLRWADVPLLALLFSFLFFLSRFQKLAHVELFGHPLTAIHLYVWGLAVLLVLARALSPRPYARGLWAPLPWLAAYFGLGLVSGLVNGGVDGVAAALQVMVITTGPPLLAWIAVESLPRNRAATVVATRSVVLVLGVVTPLILLLSALKPDVFASVLGWGAFIDWGEGFLRGWSPLGTTIVTGCLVVVAFGLAVHEAVARRCGLHVAVAVIAATSILFTAARSVLIIFFVFNGAYWLLVRRWNLFFRYALPPGLAMGAVVLWSLVVGGISFDRFLMANDYSTLMRFRSAREAVAQGLDQPLTGRGPGLLYTEIRDIWVWNESGMPLVKERIVGNTLSAMEPHNVYALLIAEHGLLGATAFVGAFLLALVRAWRVRPGQDVDDRSRRAMFVALWISLALVLTTASWPLLNTHFSFFFWLLVFLTLHWVENRRPAGVDP